jgi:uncharacterized protein involved in tolerance to divalent cations
VGTATDRPPASLHFNNAAALVDHDITSSERLIAATSCSLWTGAVEQQAFRETIVKTYRAKFCTFA